MIKDLNKSYRLYPRTQSWLFYSNSYGQPRLLAITRRANHDSSFSLWLGWREFFACFVGTKVQLNALKAFAQHFQAVDAVAFPYGRSAQWAFFNAVGIKNANYMLIPARLWLMPSASAATSLASLT